MAANHQIEYNESTAEVDYGTLYCRRVKNVDGHRSQAHRVVRANDDASSERDGMGRGSCSNPQRGREGSVRARNDALMKQVLDLLAENSALKAELQRKEEVIQELRANGRKKVAQRLEEAEKKD